MSMIKLLASLFATLLMAGCGTFAGTDVTGEDEGSSGNATTKYEIKITESNGLYITDDEEEDVDDEADSQENDAVEEPDADDLSACKGLFGDDIEIVKVTGKEETVELSADDILAVRITGKANTVNVSVKPAVTATDDIPGMKGMCFFLAGKGAAANVDLENFKMDTFSWTARGKDSETSLVVGDGAEVSEILADARGSGASLKVSGSGTYTCPELTNSKEAKGKGKGKGDEGNDILITCE